MSPSLSRPLLVDPVRPDEILSLAKLALQPAFQPIAEAATGLVFGYESLMRGHDRLGFHSPHDLLDRAEAEGQLLPLEQMVASRALAIFADLTDFSTRTLFLNVDSRMAGDLVIFAQRLSASLAAALIPASAICFEMSERFDHFAGGADLAADFRRLNSMGFKLAIDDFGVGFNGMKLLCDLPVDYIKIDRYFVSEIERNARKRHVLRQLVNASHRLGTRVIAEGVENEAEFLICRDLGCDLVQGYYVARPTSDPMSLQTSYPHLEQAGRRRVANGTLDSVLIRQQVEAVPTVLENEGLDAVFDFFRQSPERSFVPVTNANGEPRGILHEHYLKEMIYHPFGRDLLQNKLYRRTVRDFVMPAPIADLDMPTEEILRAFADMDGSDCVILTENMRYVGILSASALLRILHEKQLKHAQEENPLTGLPGNRAIRDYIQTLVQDGDEERFVCYCDFDNFKPYNDAYGFQKGDLAITLFAALMRRHFIGEGTFIAHVGGDDFFVGVRGMRRADLEVTLTRLLADFTGDVRQLYGSQDLANGGIQGTARDGSPARFPLMRCSIAVLMLPRGQVFSHAQPISMRIAKAKKHAKSSVTGLVFDTVDGGIVA
ncbi:diguanylate cyclase [Xaviernesmea oryzae]|uniref:Diguanylate cyclase n=1 Tax=Xaviernesmea oryzae TaxID=464029 RepID=A0A1Q9B3M6_9HYPH|nr:GGDEF domain-containing protein [Xaviernesmea oryzae]OLP62633.1 diguanylate cyclase [Xaviernesmea oryzae]SEM25381.1 diguanylate cyclase (GGDEF) domain-containing protein [Xaviernesmea oryzae]